jgi:hypothetical protein
VIERVARPYKAARWQWLYAFVNRWRRLSFVLQDQYQNALEAPHIN